MAKLSLLYKELSPKKIQWDLFALMVLAAVLRFAFLNIKPAHADEGVNGWFADVLAQLGYFRYDPTNFHGPLPIYILYFFKAFGRNLVELRAGGSLFGLLTVWMTFKFEKFWGRRIALMAATLVAVSPAMLFYSRGTIHEPMLLFFMVAAIYGYFSKSPWIFFLAWASGIATKETWAITFFSFGLAALLSKEFSFKKVNYREFLKNAYPAIAVSVMSLALLFSGFGKNIFGIIDFFKGYMPWLNTASGAGQEKPAWYWVELFLRYEWAVLFGLFFAVQLLWSKDKIKKTFAYFALIQYLIYTVIPYKTPWCILQISWPFFLIAALGLERLKKQARNLLLGLLVLSSLVFSVRLNFFNYDDEKEPYAYIQTYRDFNDILNFILEQAELNPELYNQSAVVAMGNPWPVPWYLGDFTAVGYHYQGPPLDPRLLASCSFLIVDVDKAQDIDSQLKLDFYKHQLKVRPHMGEVIVYFSKKMFQNEFK